MNSLSDQGLRSQISQSNSSPKPKRWMRWQFVVTPNSRGSAEIGQAIFVHRTDSAQSVPPSNLLKTAAVTSRPQAGISPHISQNRRPQSTGFSSNHSGTPEKQLKRYFQEFSYRLSNDICPILFDASDALNSILKRVQRSTYLSKADVQKLKGEVYRLGMLASWSNSANLQALIEKKNLPLFRARFRASNFMEQLSSNIAELCMTHSLEIEWQGWQQALPDLYVDPFYLSCAMVNMIVSMSAGHGNKSAVKIEALAPKASDENFTIQIKSSQPQLSWETIRLINGPEDWLPNRISDRGFLIAKRLIKTIGGHLSAVNQSADEITLRVSIPTDSPRSLLRSWIAPITQACTANTVHQIRLFAVRCEPQLANSMNDLLHSKATMRDMVVRATSNRWLILEWQSGNTSINCLPYGSKLTNELMQPRILKAAPPGLDSQAHSTPQWLSACVYRSAQFQNDARGPGSKSKPSISSVVRELTLSMQQLLGDHHLIVESLVAKTLYSSQSPDFPDIFSRLLEGAEKQSAKSQQDSHHLGDTDGPSAEFLANVIHRWKRFQSERFEKVG